MMNIVHGLTVTQYARVEKKAKASGKTISQYLYLLFAKKVGTTPSKTRSTGTRH